MRQASRSALSVITILGLLAFTSQLNLMAAGQGARLEGILVGVDGRPATGHRIHLIDGDGSPLASATTAGDGLYSFPQLAAGEYGLMVEGPAGQLGALAGPPLRLGENELARRDLKLLEAEPDTIDQALGANYGLKARYASMTTAEQVWTWVVIVIIGGLTLYLIFNDEDDVTTFRMGSSSSSSSGGGGSP